MSATTARRSREARGIGAGVLRWTEPPHYHYRRPSSHMQVTSTAPRLSSHMPAFYAINCQGVCDGRLRFRFFSACSTGSTFPWWDPIAVLLCRRRGRFGQLQLQYRATIERAFGCLVRRLGVLWRPLSYSVAMEGRPSTRHDGSATRNRLGRAVDEAGMLVPVSLPSTSSLTCHVSAARTNCSSELSSPPTPST